jgi:pyruvate,water dikinase
LACLTNEHVLQISETLDKLAKAFGKPQDIEFAVSNNQVYLLQARPITNLNKVSDTNGEFIVWDNSNIIESYPGVTTPLTFSFIIKLYEAVYKQFSSLMGVSDEVIEKENHTYANMLGLIQGRVYYNLLSWYKVLQLFPGYSVNAEFMEKMMGVKERFDLPQKYKLTKLQAYKSLGFMAVKMIKNLISLPKQRDQFLKDLDVTMKEYNAIDFDNCRPDELMHLYFRLENTLLKKWKAPLINDFFAMIYYGTLQKLITKYNIQHNGNLHNDLLCGSKDIISTEPVHRLLEISTTIINTADCKKLFLEQDANTILLEFKKNKHQAISKLIYDYIDKFGERCVGELKLETISYKQEPTYLINIIKSYVAQNVTKRLTENNIEEDLRKNAEASVKKALKGKFVKKAFFNYWLRVTRALVSNRENLRYERTRAFGVARSIFSAMGKQFYAESLINHQRDIFYLTKDEIFDFIKGTSANKDLKAFIDIRKKEFELYQILTPTAERIKTNGIVYQGNDFYKNAYTQTEIQGDLKGIGCCPGIVKGKVKIVKNPNEVNTLNGDILVTASTDPGWVTLFPTASAILVERGSLLSHSAIVSREMGIPCIVGITGLLNVLQTGDEIEMDGSTGQIKISTKNEEPTTR